MFPESQLEAALAGIASQPVHGPFSRFVELRHSVTRSTGGGPLWGMGSLLHGGRFTPKGALETLYLAEDPITGLAEVMLVAPQRQAAPLTYRTPPWVHITVEGVLTRVLDLANPQVQSALGTSEQELTGAWRLLQVRGAEAPTQTLGRVCHRSGRLDGIRYPSSKNPGGVCVAVFPNRLVAPAYIEVFDPYGDLAQRLP